MSQELPALPRGFVQWVPFLWSRVLFPGRPAPDTVVRTRSLLILLILPAVLLYPTLSFRLLEPDEGRYAEIAREMVQNREWVVPTLQGEPYLDKPPLFYWLVALSYKLFGTSDAVARIVPALSIHLTVLLVYLIGRRSLGERSAFWASFLLSLAPGFVGMGRLLILDGLLTLFITLATMSLFEAVRGETFQRGWWYLGAAACGLGVLTKGPVALVLPLIPLLVFRRLAQHPVAPSRSHWLGLFGVVLLVNLPWYVGIFLRQPVFLKYFFWEHNVLRFFQPFDHLQPVWYYVPILLAGLLPTTLLLIPFARHLVSGDPEATRSRSPALGFYLLAGAWCLAFFSLSGAKLPTYILPAMPLFLLAFGDFFAHSAWRHSFLTKTALAFNVALVGFGLYLALPWYANYRSPMRERETVAKFCGDSSVPVFTYPRNCDSIGFYLDRDDLKSVRSKFTQSLIEAMLEHPRSVVAFNHRHSYDAFKHLLPPQLQIVEMVRFRQSEKNLNWIERLAGDTPWGLCDLAIVERK